MGSFPYGPHGPQTSPYDVRPNPTPAGTFQNIGGGGAAASTAYGGGGGAMAYGGGGGGGFGLLIGNVIFSFFMMAVVWMPTIGLYPVSIGAALFAGFGSASMLARVLPPDGREVAALGGVIIGWIVAGLMMRLEYRLAEKVLLYRLARHIVRLLLLGILLVPMMMRIEGISGPEGDTMYVFTVFSNPGLMRHFLFSTKNLAMWFGLLAAVHFMLWNFGWLRRFWHRRLVYIGLK